MARHDHPQTDGLRAQTKASDRSIKVSNYFSEPGSSRSIGDHVASTVGVSPEPEFYEVELSEDDKFLVLASDGVWEFIFNEDVRFSFSQYLGCQYDRTILATKQS